MSSMLSWTGKMGSSRDCQAKGRMSGMIDSTTALRMPILGQNTTICRSSSAAAQHYDCSRLLCKWRLTVSIAAASATDNLLKREYRSDGLLRRVLQTAVIAPYAIQ